MLVKDITEREPRPIPNAYRDNLSFFVCSMFMLEVVLEYLLVSVCCLFVGRKFKFTNLRG